MVNLKKFEISEDAAQRINEIVAQESENLHLRVSVLGGGCAGFSYKFDLVRKIEKEDLIFEKDGAKILIDKTFMPYLIGSIIEFEDDLIGKSFKINNPNATSSCGCGTSFSI
ncbi:MAG: iron-sulfur cluster assembly accessory protein [Pseudomonadota bacterium]|nr:iron-sulfur cluster assembly accessory protein [Pseudomonadota bacterium]MEE3294971.1 iron-sulfur cluster assembly accessory protein [Pseudomonadota bacterium]